MKVLIVGAGAREQSLIAKLALSPHIKSIVVFPPNPISSWRGYEALDCPKEASWREVVKHALAQGVDWALVGPEQPLAEGFADTAALLGLKVFGPTQAAAKLESSKAFSKELMKAAGIPTASYYVAQDQSSARKHAQDLLKREGAVVLKASGLAQGKGVFVCDDMAALDAAFEQLYGPLAAACSELVIESRLLGRECSFFVFLGQGQPAYLGFAVDHKRLSDGNLGPNTGGMGSYAPVPWLPPKAGSIVAASIVNPLLKELARRNLEYTGCLYVGLMWTANGPMVIEFNARLGDPECQALVHYDQRDWAQAMIHKLGLGGSDQQFMDPDFLCPQSAAVSIVMAGPSYPYAKDDTALRLNEAWFQKGLNGASIYGAQILARGEACFGSGRILSVVGHGMDLAQARAQAYGASAEIRRQNPTLKLRSDIAELTTDH